MGGGAERRNAERRFWGRALRSGGASDRRKWPIADRRKEAGAAKPAGKGKRPLYSRKGPAHRLSGPRLSVNTRAALWPEPPPFPESPIFGRAAPGKGPVRQRRHRTGPGPHTLAEGRPAREADAKRDGGTEGA